MYLGSLLLRERREEEERDRAEEGTGGRGKGERGGEREGPGRGGKKRGGPPRPFGMGPPNVLIRPCARSAKLLYNVILCELHNIRYDIV